jgi:quercetin dioxygenase-like cupin family protein
MKHVPKSERPPQPIDVEGATGVAKSGLITASDDSPTVAMRHFRLEPGGRTPWHAHDWEHVVYVLEGEGTLVTEGKETPFGAGDALLVDPDEQHNFLNRGDGALRFLCIVPLRGD